MKKLLVITLIALVVGLSFVLANVVPLFYAQVVDPAEKKWRVAYYEGGPYIDYQRIFAGTIKGLIKIGDVEKGTLPGFRNEESRNLWHWLGDHTINRNIEFVRDAYYSADWDEEKRKEIVEELMYRLNEKKDIDLLICMGTWAGQDFANNKHSVPTAVFSTSNPVSAEIIKSYDDSGFNHVVATFDPNIYERQLIIFHEMIGFEKLGIAYEDSIDGRSYSAINTVEKVAKERGFELFKCYTVSDIGDLEEEAESVSDCFKVLSENVDAIYVTQQGGIRLETISELADIAIQHGVPTFSQAGPLEVKYGFLASITPADYDFVGEFNAEILDAIFHGANLRYLPQVYEQAPKLALNLETARRIGFKPSLIMMGATDELYDEIFMP